MRREIKKSLLIVLEKEFDYVANETPPLGTALFNFNEMKKIRRVSFGVRTPVGVALNANTTIGINFLDLQGNPLQPFPITSADFTGVSPQLTLRNQFLGFEFASDYKIGGVNIDYFTINVTASPIKIQLFFEFEEQGFEETFLDA